MKKRSLWAAACLLAALCLSGCGKEETRERGIGGYIYTAEEVTDSLFSDDQGKIENLKCRGDFLYYCQHGGIYRRPLKGDAGLAEGQGKAVVKAAENKILEDYTADNEGNIYYVLADYTTDYQSGKMEITGETLTAQGEDGKRLYSLDLDVSRTVDGWNFSECLALDDKKHTFFLTKDILYVIDGEGKEICRISVEEYAPKVPNAEERLLEGAGGKVYYCADGSLQGGRLEVYEITEENGRYGLKRLEGDGWEQKGANGRLFGSSGGLMYNSGDGILRRYGKEGTWQELLRWSDSGLTMDASEIVPLSEEGMLVFYSLESELYALTRTPAKDVPEREELVLACYVAISADLEKAVAEFNRMDGRYHITVEICNGMGAEERLDARIVSSDPPDMLAMMNLDMTKYAKNQALEDLYPYLETSDALGKEMFLENVLEGYTFGGKLAGIPPRIRCRTVMGRVSQAGAEAGWTMEEVRALAAGYPEHRLLTYNSFSFLLDDFCGDYILEKYINWEEGQCDFDSDEFRSLLEWIAGCRSQSGSLYWGGPAPEDALLAAGSLDSVRSFVDMEGSFGEKYVLKGYPSLDGRALHHGEGQDGVCILESSRHKEGAWSFLEYLLGEYQEGRDEFNELFSSRRDLLAKMEEEALEIEYWEDENGETLLNQDGSLRKKEKGERLTEGKWEPYYNLSREETDGILEVLGMLDFTPRSDREQEVFGIIEKEMESYFDGYKSLEEVTEIIQNRVQILVQENQQ